MIKNSNLPLFSFFWHKKAKLSTFKILNEKHSGENNFFHYLNIKPQPRIISSGNVVKIIIGSPIINQKINSNIPNDYFFKLTKLKDLNGEFVIILIDKTNEKVFIANDRFSSIPLYFCNNSEFFFLSTSYYEVIKRLKEKNLFKMINENFFEYIYFQRLLGDKLYDKKSFFLNSSSLLEVSRSNFSQKYYWKPCFTKTSLSNQELINKMCNLMENTVKKKTSDKQSFGLFLSGGFDSRSIAISSKKKLKCITYSFMDNYEVNCARRVAESLGHDFYFHGIQKNLFSKNLEELNLLCQGMFTIDNALFIDPVNFKKLNIDVMLNGHGFDYLFQGMYLPSKFIKIFGSSTFFKSLSSYNSDISLQFMKEISFRLKYVDIFGLLINNKKKLFNERLYNSCKEIEENCKMLSDDREDIWEYFLIHNIGRHYSQPNLLSQRINVELRTPIFENEIFNFYLSLLPTHRLSSEIFRRSLLKLNKKTAMIESGNYGIALSASSTYKTYRLIKRKLLRHLTGNKSYRTPYAEDRTWPDRDRYIDSDQKFLKEIENSINSDLLKDTLNYFDWKKVSDLFERYKMKKIDSVGGFFISLLTLKKFLERI